MIGTQTMPLFASREARKTRSAFDKLQSSFRLNDGSKARIFLQTAGSALLKSQPDDIYSVWLYTTDDCIPLREFGSYEEARQFILTEINDGAGVMPKRSLVGRIRGLLGPSS